MKTNNEVMNAKNKTIINPITAYDLYDFSILVQEAVLEGYRLSTENAYFPVQLGPSLYTAVLIKEEQKEQPNEPNEIVSEVAQKETEDKQKGRTRKVTKE